MLKKCLFLRKYSKSDKKILLNNFYTFKIAAFKNKQNNFLYFSHIIQLNSRLLFGINKTFFFDYYLSNC